MKGYIARRFLLMIPTLFGLTVLIFGAMRVLPGGGLGAFVVDDMVSQQLTDVQIQAIKRELGLDRPLHVQYYTWIRDVFDGSFGYSQSRAGEPIRDLILSRGIISAEIGILAVLLSWVIGLPVGMLSAIKPNSIWDKLASTTTVLFLALPNFWLGLLIILCWVVFWGYHPPVVGVNPWVDPVANFKIIIGPTLVMATSMAAVIARMARSSLFEVLRQDYVKTARSKGLAERVVIARHVLPNALMPVLTISGVMLGFVMGGSVAVEVAFTTPGLGRSIVQATIERDMNVVQSLVLLYGMIFILVNFIIDLLYSVLDPRVRMS
ncbi:MAG TPA: peptide ABC transporter permease [Dehalococcoidia bacterium]|nr:peptide ABC transporter permease [Chloroflexota bacterium]HCE75802.1 peptide ABC transporter permease [Dehalococcoidia bacterium]